MKKVLIADGVHPLLRKFFKDKSYEVLYRPEITYDEVIEIFPDLHGIVVNTRTPVRRNLIDLNPDLQFIARLGSGLDIIDVEYAATHGIHTISAPEGNANAVAEHTLGLLLSHSHNLSKADRSVMKGEWPREDCRGTELEGKCIGVIGVGNNGSKFIEKCASLSTEVIFFDKYKQHFPSYVRYASEVTENEILQRADYISLHIPLSDETRQMVDRQWLGACKNSAVLVNTSRGQIVNTSDLLQAIKSGNFGGACLDVLEQENPETRSREYNGVIKNLYTTGKVIMTPHVAGWTKESFRKISAVLTEKINNLIK